MVLPVASADRSLPGTPSDPELRTGRVIQVPSSPDCSSAPVLAGLGLGFGAVQIRGYGVTSELLPLGLSTADRRPSQEAEAGWKAGRPLRSRMTGH